MWGLSILSCLSILLAIFFKKLVWLDQSDKFQSLLSLAQKHPMYSTYPPESFSNLSSMPLLSKKQIYDHMERISSDQSSFYGAYLSMSGGTSDVSVFFIADLVENYEQRKALGSLIKTLGVSGRTNIAAILHSAKPMYKALDLVATLVELGGGTALPITSSETDTATVEFCRRFHATSLHGSPTRLIGLAKHLQDKNESISTVKQVVYGGEKLTDNQADFLRSVFGQNLWISSFLASAEVGPYGIKPPWLPSGFLIVDMDVTWIEIIDPDENGVGTIALTNLMRKRIPLIRYDSGDVGRIISKVPRTLQWIQEHFKVTKKDLYFSDNPVLDFSERYTVVEFIGRNLKKSFQFWTNYYPIEAFSTPINSQEGVLQSQIIISLEDHRDFMRVLVVRDKDADEDELRQGIEDILVSIFGDKAYLNICAILFLELDQLKQGAAGGKVIPLVDLRNA